MVVYVGDDWAEDHHDLHLMDEAGERLAARRVPEGVAGVTALHGLVAQHASGPGEVILGIETDRGPWVSAPWSRPYLKATASTRSTRARRRVTATATTSAFDAKSDASDARLLADLVRTDRHNHREVAGDSDDRERAARQSRAHCSPAPTSSSSGTVTGRCATGCATRSGST